MALLCPPRFLSRLCRPHDILLPRGENHQEEKKHYFLGPLEFGQLTNKQMVLHPLHKRTCTLTSLSERSPRTGCPSFLGLGFEHILLLLFLLRTVKSSAHHSLLLLPFSLFSFPFCSPLPFVTKEMPKVSLLLPFPLLWCQRRRSRSLQIETMMHREEEEEAT